MTNLHLPIESDRPFEMASRFATVFYPDGLAYWKGEWQTRDLHGHWFTIEDGDAALRAQVWMFLSECYDSEDTWPCNLLRVDSTMVDNVMDGLRGLSHGQIVDGIHCESTVRMEGQVVSYLERKEADRFLCMFDAKGDE